MQQHGTPDNVSRFVVLQQPHCWASVFMALDWLCLHEPFDKLPQSATSFIPFADVDVEAAGAAAQEREKEAKEKELKNGVALHSHRFYTTLVDTQEESGL